MPGIDADPKITDLFHEIQQIMDVKTVIRREASTVSQLKDYHMPDSIVRKSLLTAVM